jgi:cardiolipin synthase
MNWQLILEILYILLVIFTCLRIIYDVESTEKTLAYILLAITVPFAGVLFYYLLGNNYKKNKIYTKKLIANDKILNRLKEATILETMKVLEEGDEALKKNSELARLLLNDRSPLTKGNEVKLLVNGENKFPEVLQELEKAKHHIHLEYYIFEDDEIGNKIKEILIRKAKEGVHVRFIYDDFGSRSIRKKLVPELKKNGVEAHPFFKIYFIAFANRINYRNHRKIIIIDGCTAFVGGINVSDRYINAAASKQVFWRDTHLMIKGPGIRYLQYIFLCDWNFCADTTIEPPLRNFFNSDEKTEEDKVVQIAASGPDSDIPTILYSLIQVISLATKEILITTPYFIPVNSLMDSLRVAALSGLDIKLLVPETSDSLWVNAAAHSYYGDLLEAGVKVYLYKKGFVHAKTIVVDGNVSVVGTANLDHRSFDLNFEVNAVVYDKQISEQLRETFYFDLKDAQEINKADWNARPLWKYFPEKVARLLSPLL